jgi:hypothetical protein
LQARKFSFFWQTFSDLFGRVPDKGHQSGKGPKGRPNSAQANEGVKKSTSVMLNEVKHPGIY